MLCLLCFVGDGVVVCLFCLFCWVVLVFGWFFCGVTAFLLVVFCWFFVENVGF